MDLILLLSILLAAGSFSGSTHGSTKFKIAPTSVTAPITKVLKLPKGFLNLNKVWYCYVCSGKNCTSTDKSLVNCAEWTTIRACYYILKPDGTEIRSCGGRRLDRWISKVGCNKLYEGFTTCKCIEQACNGDTISGLDTNLSSEPNHVYNIRDIITTKVLTKRSITYEPWYCYSCNPCHNSRGTLVNCALNFSERSCYYLETSNGDVLRACGTPELEEAHGSAGCISIEDYTLCRCAEQSCNLNPQTTPDTRNTSLGVRTSTGTREWYCYSCNPCGEFNGPMVNCALHFTARSCYYVQTANGTGKYRLNLIISSVITTYLWLLYYIYT